MEPRHQINHARALLVIALASLESGNTFECAKFLYLAGDAVDTVTHQVQLLNIEGREREAA